MAPGAGERIVAPAALQVRVPCQRLAGGDVADQVPAHVTDGRAMGLSLNAAGAVVIRLVDLLERQNVPYVMMGGGAVRVWGIPRATYDVDVTLSVGRAGLRRFLDLVKKDGFEVDAPFEGGLRGVLAGVEKLRIHWWTESSRRVEVDVFLVTTLYQQSAFSRRVRVHIEDRELWVLGPADLVLHKLLATRPKDLADVQNVLSIQGARGRPHSREWARRLGVEARLDEALTRAGLGDDDGPE